MRSVLSWVFVRGPAACYAYFDGGGSSLLTLVVIALTAGAGAGIGALVGLVTPLATGDAAFGGVLIGLGVLIGWLLWTLLAVAVFWVRGVAPGAVAVGGKAPRGRHAGRAIDWRQPGDPLVPGSLVAFLGLMAVVATGSAVYCALKSQPLAQPTTVVDGTVVAVQEPGWGSKGAGSVVIRYGDHTFKSKRDPGDRFFELGDVVPVEYSVQEPGNGRSLWVAEDYRSTAHFLRVAALSLGGLTVVSGAGWGVGRWRASGRRSGGSGSDTQKSG